MGGDIKAIFMIQKNSYALIFGMTELLSQLPKFVAELSQFPPLLENTDY
jgi:hypothetical protein